MALVFVSSRGLPFLGFFLLFFPKALYRWGRSRLCECSLDSFTCCCPGNTEKRAAGLWAAVEHPTSPPDPPFVQRDSPPHLPKPLGEGRWLQQRGQRSGSSAPRANCSAEPRPRGTSSRVRCSLGPRGQTPSSSSGPRAASNEEVLSPLSSNFPSAPQKKIVLGTCVTN